jgi:hypothetical protein
LQELLAAVLELMPQHILLAVLVVVVLVVVVMLAVLAEMVVTGLFPVVVAVAAVLV